VIAAVLAALKFAPAVFSAGKEIVGAFTGEEVPPDATPEDVAARIEALPPEQRAIAVGQVIAAKTREQELDTERFRAMNEGDAEKIKESARPQIALRAMRVVTMFSAAISILFIATVLEWAVRAYFAFKGTKFPVTESLWDLIADAQPVAEMIWAPLLGSFWACVEVIKKYMGCRERDKAQEYEARAGRPLNASAATIEAAGGGVASIIRAVRGK
jgi:hypothetical protein